MDNKVKVQFPQQQGRGNRVLGAGTKLSIQDDDGNWIPLDGVMSMSIPEFKHDEEIEVKATFSPKGITELMARLKVDEQNLEAFAERLGFSIISWETELQFVIEWLAIYEVMESRVPDKTVEDLLERKHWLEEKIGNKNNT